MDCLSGLDVCPKQQAYSMQQRFGSRAFKRGSKRSCFDMQTSESVPSTFSTRAWTESAKLSSKLLAADSECRDGTSRLARPRWWNRCPSGAWSWPYRIRHDRSKVEGQVLIAGRVALMVFYFWRLSRGIPETLEPLDLCDFSAHKTYKCMD